MESVQCQPQNRVLAPSPIDQIRGRCHPFVGPTLRSTGSGSGDVARKKLDPALYMLATRGRLGVPVVGVARSAWTDEQLRAYAREAVRALRFGSLTYLR